VKIINVQSIFFRIKKFGVPTIVASFVAALGAVDVSAHGYVTSPKARVLVCNENNPETPTLPACIAAKAAGNIGFYSPQSIAIGGAKDNHQQLIPDGKLCSAGVSGYEGLDLARNDWPATQVQPGVKEFVWTNTAQHKTMYFRYYITKQGFNPGAAPLKWSDLEQIYQSNPVGQEANSRHPVPLPQRTGKHIVYSIWQRDYSDAPEGFYQCIDVEFGSSTSSSSSSIAVASSSKPSSTSSSVASSSASSLSGDTCASLPAWDANTIYNKPQQVKYSNKRYQANYWTQGNNPELTSGQYNYWLDLGACVTSGSSQSSVVSTSSAQSSSVRSSSSSSSRVASSSSKSSVASSVGNSCTSPAYVNGASYATGALVQNVGSEYRCTVGGWCTVGGPYAPGTGWAWTNAWVVTRTCQ
jgi:chitin-binding protein